MLVLGGLGVACGGGVALDLADDRQAVYRTVGRTGQGGAEVQYALNGVLLGLALRLCSGGSGGFCHEDSSLSALWRLQTVFHYSPQFFENYTGLSFFASLCYNLFCNSVITAVGRH